MNPPRKTPARLLTLALLAAAPVLGATVREDRPAADAAAARVVLSVPVFLPSSSIDAAPIVSAPAESSTLPTAAEAADAPAATSREDAVRSATPPPLPASYLASWRRNEAEASASEREDGRGLFDGGTVISDDAPWMPRRAARAAVDRLAASRFGRFVPARLAAKLNAPAPKFRTSDDFHGPLHAKLGYGAQLLEGVKTGFLMTGVATVISTVLAFLQSLFQWQLAFPSMAKAFGRVELLAHLGPLELQQGLEQSPLKLILLDIPRGVVWEEFFYRGLVFGGLWAVLAALRPLGDLIGRLFEGARLDRVMHALPGLLRRVSRWAFPIAALVSAAMFGRAHLEAWGYNPESFLIPAALGWMLARLAYRTRSPLPPLTAHLTYALILIATMAAAASTAQMTALAVGATAWVSAGYALYMGVAYLKRRSAALGRPWGWHRPRLGTAARGVALALAPLALLAGLALVGQWSPSGTLTTVGQKPAAALALVETPAAKRRALTDQEFLAVGQASVPKILIKNAEGRTLGSGSSFIITKDGLAISNNHVVGEAGIGGYVGVSFADGTETRAKVLAVNPHIDVGIIQLEPRPEGYVPVAIAKEPVKVGDKIVNAGYPFGIDLTIGYGQVTGLAGERRQGYEIQTQAPVNPGNSGGPSFNVFGEVVGINTAILAPAGQWAGLSMVRGADVVLEALKRYQATGSISPGWMGVVADLSTPHEPAPGVLVELVEPGSAAAMAGLRAGDRIVKIDGRKLPVQLAEHPTISAKLLQKLVATKKLGDKVSLTYERDNGSATVDVTLGEWISRPGAMMAPIGKKPPKDEPSPNPDDED